MCLVFYGFVGLSAGEGLKKGTDTHINAAGFQTLFVTLIDPVARPSKLFGGDQQNHIRPWPETGEMCQQLSAPAKNCTAIAMNLS